MKVALTETAVEGIVQETAKLEDADFLKRSGFRVGVEDRVLRLETRREAFMLDIEEEVWRLVSSINSEVRALRDGIDELSGSLGHYP